MATDPQPKIYQAMAAILEAMPAVGKDSQNTGLNFKFRSVDAIVNELNVHLGKQGVFVLPEVEDVKVEPKAKGYAAVVTVAYIFMADDGSSVRAVSVGEGHDFADKAVSKAMTMAYKTCLGQVFAIATEDDPDGGSTETTPRGEAPAGPRTQPASPSGGEPQPRWYGVKAKIDKFLAVGTAGYDGRREQLLAALAKEEIPGDLAAQTDDQLTATESVLAGISEPFSHGPR